MEFLTSLEFGKLIWLILGVFEVIVRLTPSQADNSILNKVIWIVEKLVPNKSSLDIPGFLGIPAVIIMTSDFLVSS